MHTDPIRDNQQKYEFSDNEGNNLVLFVTVIMIILTWILEYIDTRDE